MSGTFDYLSWRGDLPISAAVPFCEVDSLILCEAAYLPFNCGDGVTLGEAAANLLSGAVCDAAKERFRTMAPNYEKLTKVLLSSKRFQNMHLYRYRSEFNEIEQKQFSAVTFETGDGAFYIAYRGTDNTIIGWKEDFNMSFCTPVPAQMAAVQYLKETAAALMGPLRVGGHSKGGNLAVYAASFCGADIQRRLTLIHNHDGPGFSAGVLEHSGHSAVKDRIRTFVPQSSIVGMLLEHEEEYTIVKSDGVGLLQHDPFSWQTAGDAFITVEERTMSSKFADFAIKEWLSTMDDDQRRRFADGLYEILSATGARTLRDLTQENFLKSTGRILKALGGVDDDTKKLLLKTSGALVKCAGLSLNSKREEKKP